MKFTVLAGAFVEITLVPAGTNLCVKGPLVITDEVVRQWMQ